MILVKTGLEVARKYSGKSVRAKIGTKKQQVYFKLYCDDTDIADCVNLYRTSGNVLMLEYQGTEIGLVMADISGVYIAKTYDFGTNIVESDIQNVVDELPNGVTAIIRVPEEYRDMKFVCDMSQKYENVRFCGGTMFCLDGCRVGCCGRDVLDAKGLKYDDTQYYFSGCSCAVETYSDTEVELEEGKIAQRAQGSGTGGGTKKKTLMFQDLLYKNGRVSL